MKKSRFTDSQIIDALKRAEAGLAEPELCRDLGISAATFYKWRAKFGGMDAMQRLLPAICPAPRGIHNSPFGNRSLLGYRLLWRTVVAKRWVKQAKAA